VTACFVLTATARADNPAWMTFTSKEGKFSVSLPDKPTESTQQVKSAGPGAGTEKREIHLFSLAPAEGHAYVISYTDYPRGAIKPDKKEAFLASVCDGFVKQVGGKERARKKLSLGTGKAKHPGQEVVVAVGMAEKKQLFYRTRLYLVGDRFFQLTLMGPEDFTTDKQADEFFSSFKVEE
jgi:hypothetical protein